MTEQSYKLLETVNHLRQIDQLTCRFLVTMAAELRTLDGVFDLMKIEAGWFDIDIQEVDLEQLVERIIVTLSHYIELSYGESEREQDKIIRPRVEYAIPEGLSPVKMDGLRIERILIEVLLAAVQVNRSHESQIKFSLACNHGWLIIEVSDNGAGLPEYLINWTPDISSISQVIIERHRGEVEVKNQAGGGWVINLKLPVD